jgi:serine/threonine-protein kinase
LVALSQEDIIEMPFLPGDIIAGKYEVQKLIGSGGMGYVVAAMHVELGERVALKFLRPEALVIDELIERFSREARAAAKIKSEHIARVFDVGALPDGAPFIVMEHLDGQDLCDVLHQQGPMPVKVAVEYVMQACEALAAAHAAGVVHRDIKPENLFLTKHAQGLDFIKILDFGISKVALAQGKRAHVRTQMPLGSPVYMSPEQIRSSEQVDARTDIWSLGCVLFELLTGVVAFDEPSLMQLSAAILEHDPVPLREMIPDAPIELEQVILRCLEKDVTKRYGNIAELAIALYPFAPRRSRISAERCYHALKNAGIDCPEFEIVSVFPPSMGEMPMLTSTQPVSGVMQSSARQSPTAASIPQMRVATPATITAEELAELRPTKNYKLLGIVAFAALVGGGAYFVVQGRSVDAAGKSAAAPSAAVTLAAATPAPTSPSALPKAEARSAAPASAPTSPPVSVESLPSVGSTQLQPNLHPVPHRAAAPAPAAAKSASAPHHHSTDGDDPDVGY